jgi:protein ImuA
VAQPDLFAPGLAQAGLQPDQVIFVEAQSDKALLACCEEGLRHGGLGAVVAELSRLPMIASRRLQLAAESSGTLALVLRRWAGGQAMAEPNAAHTRWRIAALPSARLPTPGIGRARWQMELLRSRNGATGVFEVEACDAQGCLAVPAELAHRPAVPGYGRDRATG